MFQSIKIRMAFFSTVVVFFLLVVFGISLYFGLESLSYNQLNRQLVIYADAIEDSYDPATGEFKFLHEGTENYKAAQNDWVRIINKDGSVLFMSDRFKKYHFVFPLQQVLYNKSGKYLFRQFVASNKKEYRSVILAFPGKKGEKPIGWVEVWEPVKSVKSTLSFFRKLLLLSLPFALLIVAGAAYLMVQRILRPISLMAKQSEEIDHASLDQRLPVINPDDELGRLATRFNYLLARLENSFRQHKELLGNISHELKTPLAILRSHWEAKISNTQIPESIREQLTSDVEELARLAKMVDDLNLLSRSQEMTFEIKKEKIDLPAMLQVLVEDIRFLAEVKYQQVIFKTASQIFISGDVRLLKRLFLNILDNSVKYTQECGMIEVNCVVRNSAAIISITDNGPGIPESDLAHVFDRFFRAGNNHNSEIKGSGLGLTLAKWIAEVHQGQLVE